MFFIMLVFKKLKNNIYAFIFILIFIKKNKFKSNMEILDLKRYKNEIIRDKSITIEDLNAVIDDY